MERSPFDPRKNPDWHPYAKVTPAMIAKVVRDYRNDVSVSKIASDCGVGVATVYRWLDKAGATRDRHYSQQVYEEAVSLRVKDGLTNAQISERTGVPVDAIWRWMGRTPERLGGEVRYPIGFRERARYLKGCGLSIREIGTEMGVPRATVGDWVRGTPCDIR